MIATAGTIVGELEKKYVVDAVSNLNNPAKFDYYIKKFEESFADYIGVSYALATTNGTSALHLAFLAMGIGKGDEVIVPNLAFVALANAISYTGATVVPVDVKIDDWTVDPEEIDRAINKKTKLIAPVHMFARTPDKQIYKRFGLPIVDDACPAVGSANAGTLADIACFSFQGAKTIAIGEGGMLVTNNKTLYDRAKKMGNVAKTDANFNCDEIGYNYRISNIQAAVGLAQLENVDMLVENRMQIHKWYGDYCEQALESDEVCWQNTYLVEDRDKFRQHLLANTIDTRAVYPAISSYPMYKKSMQGVATNVAEKGVNLPSAAYLTEKDIDYVKYCIETYNKSRSN